MDCMTSRSFSSSAIYFVFLSLISLGLFFLDSQRLLVSVRGAFDTISVPSKGVMYSSKKRLDDAFSFLTFWKNGTVKLRFLEQRVAELTVDSEKLAALEKENTALRDQIGVTSPNTYTLILAQTIGFDRYLFINRGVADGVKKGMAVLSKDIFVGTVINTSWRSSSVLLPTDPDSKIPVQTVKTGAKGILLGQFGSSIMMDKVVQSEELTLGDTVVTSGEGNLPRGFVVGTVEKVYKQETELFQKAEVKALLNFGHIEYVFVDATL